MRRFWMILPLLTVLAACEGAPPPGQGVPQEGIRASFPPGGVVNLIRVDALDRQPLRAVELVAPDGSVATASSLNVETMPDTIGGQRTLSDPWRSSMLGGNGLNPLPQGPPDAAFRSRDQLLLTASTADIPLPDPAAYRRDWAGYKIRLSFAGPRDTLDVREIPAPEPPPG